MPIKLSKSQVQALKLMDSINADKILLEFPIGWITTKMVTENLYYAWAIIDKFERAGR